MDMASRMADRRCPACDTVQPLYVSKPGSKRSWQRGAADVIPCPGCDQPLRLEADTRDPRGIKAAVVMVVLLGGSLFAVLHAATLYEFGEWMLGGILLVLVALGAGLAILWNGKAAQRRRVVVAMQEENE